MNILAWVILGLIAGAIAKAIDPAARGGGILGTLILGLIGSLVGGTLTTFFTTGHVAVTATSFSIPGVFVAIVGAIIFVFIWHRIVGRAA
ncbi:MAG: GlsB/YeaQ/YmgE family stress response membrane protein [Chroococcidiopsidaceae cyanobacterium CP_BM_ER_R8_30]|nr:GlsB/YeaQ/YmgE family stress response membrane protein [Chroococcidiopsidaceae cyanobacterium CP_BM_ER_R8_30]